MSESRNVVIVTGIPGVGKTTVVVEYTYRFAHQYDIVWWIRAEESASLYADLAELAYLLEIANPKTDKPDEAAKAIRKWLEKHDTAIALARFSRKNREYRVLNTTFKLNDWAFPEYKHKVTNTRLLRYLNALIEQERTAWELMKR